MKYAIDLPGRTLGTPASLESCSQEGSSRSSLNYLPDSGRLSGDISVSELAGAQPLAGKLQPRQRLAESAV